ncbi:GNAT family N-acetyltransferase [Oxalobacteraceae bacterium R-40]|uniref:GNAT family N-acetyltransferase n=1 Tax=Keguizhuia sedimenti TaxID=3064264 RepID=A0ABU1BTD2_9BURK|nr:GNAT family N-acetyltransferase [Oxalobacteraceae bacterium R-40]
MSIRNLQYLFNPKSIAVIGASNKVHGVGTTVLNNICAGGFDGAVYPVNPKYATLAGLEVYPGIAQLPVAPELAVICTPVATVPKLISELGERGTKAAIVLTAGLSAIRDENGVSMRDLMLAASRPHLLRILGPNCVGMLAPRIGLNASFAHVNALPGKIAFVSQSGAMVTGVLDWANARGIGFSKFISLGDGADIDFGDILDYLAGDPETHAILLYVEAITSARKFMSAARAAARSKPTIVIKAGRVPEGAKAAASHTGALAGSDGVYDAAFRRAGMLRVLTTEDLFDAVETLARARPLTGERLAILTNGGGPGVMATDTLIEDGGTLAPLCEQTMQKLDAVLPANWSRSNPVDIIGDAPANRYVEALEILQEDPAVDASLIIHAPTAIVPSTDIAKALIPLANKSQKNVLTCWLGGSAVARGREMFSEAAIPSYETPEKAIRGFMQMVHYRRNQQLLMQVPAALSAASSHDVSAAREVIRGALTAGRDMLSEAEAKTVLAAYGIPVVETRVVASVEEAIPAAEAIGFPVALKILSPEISHKSDVGGVALDLDSSTAVRAAGTRMKERIAKLRPDARLQGFTVQGMARRPEGRELIIGVATDPVFGPIILFGQGGIAVEVTADHAIALPPLNTVLARDLVSRTRVSKLLAGYRNRAPADSEGIYRTLVQVSDMIVDLPEITELDINPLIADGNGVIALDARIRVRSIVGNGIGRLAIRPYPADLEEWISWQGNPVMLRPIKPEDVNEHALFFDALDPDDVCDRAFTRVGSLLPSQLVRLTQIDYDREMAFIACRSRADGSTETLGVARAITDPDNFTAEFAIIVRSDLKRHGLGHILMDKLVRYCRERGTKRMVGETFKSNSRMIELAGTFGFELRPTQDPKIMLMQLDLTMQLS